MNILHFGLIFSVHQLHNRRLLLQVNSFDGVVVSHEKFVHLVEDSHAEEHADGEVLVGEGQVFLLVGLVEEEEMVGRHAIAHLVCVFEVLFGLVHVFGDAEAPHAEDSHPVFADDAALLSARGIEESGLRGAVALLGLGVGELSQGVCGLGGASGGGLHQRCLDFFELGVSGEPDVLVSFQLISQLMTVGLRQPDQIKSLSHVQRNVVLVCALKLELTKSISAVVRVFHVPAVVILDNLLQFSLFQVFQLNESQLLRCVTFNHYLMNSRKFRNLNYCYEWSV